MLNSAFNFPHSSDALRRYVQVLGPETFAEIVNLSPQEARQNYASIQPILNNLDEGSASAQRLNYRQIGFEALSGNSPNSLDRQLALAAFSAATVDPDSPLSQQFQQEADVLQQLREAMASSQLATTVSPKQLSSLSSAPPAATAVTDFNQPGSANTPMLPSFLQPYRAVLSDEALVELLNTSPQEARQAHSNVQRILENLDSGSDESELLGYKALGLAALANEPRTPMDVQMAAVALAAASTEPGSAQHEQYVEQLSQLQMARQGVAEGPGSSPNGLPTVVPLPLNPQQVQNVLAQLNAAFAPPDNTGSNASEVTALNGVLSNLVPGSAPFNQVAQTMRNLIIPADLQARQPSIPPPPFDPNNPASIQAFHEMAAMRRFESADSPNDLLSSVLQMSLAQVDPDSKLAEDIQAIITRLQINDPDLVQLDSTYFSL